MSERGRRTGASPQEIGYEGSLGCSVIAIARHIATKKLGGNVVKDSDPSKWDCPPHTKAKDDMLGAYLNGWFPILSKWNGRLLFLDGFAGKGRYNDGSEGSPLVALRHLLDHSHFSRMAGREFIFWFIEADTMNAAALQSELDTLVLGRSTWPSNVKFQVVNEKFDVTAQQILNKLRAQKASLAPTFAFVDPFGYSGLPMDLLAELLAYPKTELFVNFMVGHVQRFIERDGQERAMKSLFGLDVSEIVREWDGSSSRVEHLKTVYERQLKERIGYPYVQSFAMINETGNTGYYLMHGTRHPSGVKLMKSVMWKIDPGGGYTFSDRLAGIDVLFTPEPDTRPLDEALRRRFKGCVNVPIDEIEWFAVLETPYRETHVRKILSGYETSRLITVARPGEDSQVARKLASSIMSSE